MKLRCTATGDNNVCTTLSTRNFVGQSNYENWDTINTNERTVLHETTSSAAGDNIVWPGKTI